MQMLRFPWTFLRSRVSSNWILCSARAATRGPRPIFPFSSTFFSSRRFFYSSPLLLASVDMGTVDTTARLTELRELMKAKELSIYIVPSEDSHQSEYIAPCDARRAFISGFTGSAGTAVVTLDRAALSTDGRYFNQASKQLDSNWTLLEQGMEDVPTWQDWTAEQSEGGKNVGVDSTLLTVGESRSLSEKIKKKGGGQLIPDTQNLVDEVWGHARPESPSEKIKAHPLKFSGKEAKEKLEDVRKELEKNKSAGLVVNTLDAIAWVFNLRGSDIPYNPVFFSYALITPSSATLYVDESKFEDGVKDHLGPGVHIRPYAAIFEDLTTLGKELTESQDTPRQKYQVLTRASWALSLALGGEQNVEEIRNPIGKAKAIKNDVELEGMRQCHIRDGAALTQYFAWLEHQLVDQKATLDEVQAADKLEQIRSKGEHFVGLSFDTISSTGPNAAVIHYKPEPGSCSTIDPRAIYLCDSGAQYLDGTTDTTRTLHFGEPQEFEKKAYTLVLKGVIALDKATFPKGTHGLQLDALARQALWAEGLDYRHGTGHGVGSYLVSRWSSYLSRVSANTALKNVHEGPIGVGARIEYAEVALSPGNVISDGKSRFD